jgi:membrane protease YdiL (CAAX protease family)
MKAILKSIGYILIYFVLQSVMIMGCTFANGVTTQKEMNVYVANNILIIAIVSNFLSLFIIALIRHILRKKLIIICSFREMSAKKCCLSVIAAFSFSMLFNYILIGIHHETGNMYDQSVAYFSKVYPGLGMAMMVVALLVSAPIVEEYICRGVLVNELKQSFSPTTAIIISALIFGGMHFLAGGIFLAIGATLMGLILGVIYIKTNSLLITIIAHLSANLPDFIFMFFPRQDCLISIILSILYLFLSVCAVLALWISGDKQTV